MKTYMKTNIKKILSLMLAVLGLAALISLMPEHSPSYTAVNAGASAHQVLAQQ